MSEKTLYHCGIPKEEAKEEWWVLLSEQGIQMAAEVAVLTGKPIEFLVDLAGRSN